MKGTEELRQKLVDFLKAHELPALCAWPEKLRDGREQEAVVVSLQSMESGSPGFQDYLGEYYDPVLGWTERYGKQVKLTFGLELYGPSAKTVGDLLDRTGEVLFSHKPVGLRLVSFLSEETGYHKESGRYRCQTKVVLEAWATGTVQEDGSFTEFEVRGVTV